MRAMIRTLLTAVLLACAGTTTPSPVSLLAPDNLWRVYEGRPRNPTTMHVYIYEMMQECLGIRGRPFDEISWISADFVQRADYRRLSGVWFGELSVIVLDHQRFNDPVVVSEELLHSLLGSNDITDPHDDSRFKRCLIKRIEVP